jgi:hypothetical protein
VVPDLRRGERGHAPPRRSSPCHAPPEFHALPSSSGPRPGRSRVALGVAAQGSHGSGRARLGHPALRSTGSLRDGEKSITYPLFAIRSSCVETVVELSVSAISPSTGSVFRRSLPSTGSLGSVPPLQGYCGALRLPAVPPASLRFLRFAVPSLRLSFRSLGREARRPWARVVGRIPQPV